MDTLQLYLTDRIKYEFEKLSEPLTMERITNSTILVEHYETTRDQSYVQVLVKSKPYLISLKVEKELFENSVLNDLIYGVEYSFSDVGLFGMGNGDLKIKFKEGDVVRFNYNHCLDSKDVPSYSYIKPYACVDADLLHQIAIETHEANKFTITATTVTATKNPFIGLGGCRSRFSNVMFDHVKHIYIAKPKIIVVFDDGSKEIATCSKGDNFNETAGVLICIMKHYYSGSQTKFSKEFDILQKKKTYMMEPVEKKEPKKKKKAKEPFEKVLLFTDDGPIIPMDGKSHGSKK